MVITDMELRCSTSSVSPARAITLQQAGRKRRRRRGVEEETSRNMDMVTTAVEKYGHSSA
jgi:hypothetical protein